jgi:hypothetical protein
MDETDQKVVRTARLERGWFGGADHSFRSSYSAASTGVMDIYVFNSDSDTFLDAFREPRSYMRSYIYNR